MKSRFRLPTLPSCPAVRRGLAAAGLAVGLVLAAPGVAYSLFAGGDANTDNSVTANADIVAPAVSAATTAKTTSGIPGHLTQGSAYYAYANVSDSGAPASGISTVTADLSAITSGQTAAAYGTAGGPFSFGGTSYTYRTASLTAGSSLSQCRSAYPVTTTDVAGNSTSADQRVMIDKKLDANTYHMRVDGPVASGYLGYDSLAGAGDVNGDGRADFVAGLERGDFNGRTNSGSAYVVFGQASQTTIDAASLGTNGYRIDGAVAGDSVGYGIANAGDVNADGKSDTIVSAYAADNNGRTDSGSAYVVFGKTTTTTIDLASLGAGGFRIDGAAAGDEVISVASAGDINADGKADILVQANYTDNNGRTDSGSVYVVFGKATTTTIDLASLGAGGYRIDGPTADPNGSIGFNIDGSRDVDGDGKPDTVLSKSNADNNSRTNSGSVYVVFGKTSTTTVDLASLGAQGYRVDGQTAGDEIGRSVAVSPDMNGDGKAELILGAQSASYNSRAGSGSVYVLFGKSTTTSQDLNALGAGGFRMDGASAGDEFGYWARAGGDLNDDGIPDVLVSAPFTNYGGTDAGSVYAIFGKTTSGGIDTATLGFQGYRLDGVAADDWAGEGLGTAGDVDGDGRADLLMAADGTDYNSRGDSGSVYVVSQPWCSYRQAVLGTSGLQSYWRLGESSGTSAADSKGSVTGTYSAGYTLSATGGTGDTNTAVTATGSAPVVTFGDNYDFAGFAAFSVEAWINPSSFTLDGSYRRIVGKDGGSPAEGWDVAVAPAGGVGGGIGSGTRKISFERWAAGTATRITGTTMLTTGRWYHVVVTNRLRRPGAVAHEAVVGWHVAPAEKPLSLFVDDAADNLFDRSAIAPIVRQEDQAGAIRTGRRQRERDDSAEKGVGRLDQNAGAITGVGLAAARPSVFQVDEDLQRLSDDVVRPLTFDVHDEAHTTGVVFGAGLIQPLSGRRHAVPSC